MKYELHKEISQVYGYKRVLIRTIEELSELIQALTNPGLNDFDLSEEIVDCRMCFMWLKRQWKRKGFNYNKVAHDNNKTYNNDEQIYNLSRMQFFLTKQLRGFEIRNEHLMQMAIIYSIMDSLTEDHDLFAKNAYWTRIKEGKYARRLENCELK